METSKFRFQGTLLVPVKNIETSLNFFWAGSLKAENNEVFVIVFKAENKDEFVPLLEKDLKILQDMEQTDSVKQQIAFIEKTLSETKNPVFIKVPDQQMLDVAQGIVSQIFEKQQLSGSFYQRKCYLYIWYYCCLLTYVSKKKLFCVVKRKRVFSHSGPFITYHKRRRFCQPYICRLRSLHRSKHKRHWHAAVPRR